MGIHTNAGNLRALSSANAKNLNEHNTREWEEAHDLLLRDIYLTIPAAAIALFGAMGFTWSFTF
jgi:hypothetical protein